jgi:hypothetical protein
MDFNKIIMFLYDLFLSSPGKAITTALVLWTVYALFYKLVIIGLNRPLGEMILKTFEIDQSQKNSLHDLSVMEVHHNSSISADGHTWQVKTVYLAYWALNMMRVTVITASSLALFSAFSIFVMRLSQPIDSISIASVSETLGYGSSFFLLAYSVISLIKILSALHKMPVEFIDGQKDYKIILFSW